jgi:hypothetical protein
LSKPPPTRSPLARRRAAARVTFASRLFPLLIEDAGTGPGKPPRRPPSTEGNDDGPNPAETSVEADPVDRAGAVYGLNQGLFRGFLLTGSGQSDKRNLC